MLEVKNLVKNYKISKKSKTKTVTALNNVSITFPERGLIFLLGKSGSGKSTLLNAIGGLDTFDSGEIIIKGKSSKSFSQSDFDSYRNTFIGFIFQEYNVLEEFTVAKNLSLAIELQGKEATKEKVDELLEMVEMQDFAKRKPNQLSGGQKQRVAIARALIKNPEIIMADEPTGALDSNTGKQVMETLKNLSKEKLVIIVSHDREFAEIYGDRIIELKDGKIIRDVTKKEVEPVKTESGISIIDNDVIHIKKGQRITQTDLDQICRKILENSNNSDTIISMSDSANKEVKKATSITDDGNREVFKDTTTDDVKVENYANSNFKLIKSRLKFKDSFKMGASALKNKVGKLVFTILLSFIAFAMFGIIDTISTFNRADAVFNTAKQFENKYVSLLKESKGEYDNTASPFTDKDISILQEKFPNVELLKVANKNIRFGSMYYSDINSQTINVNGLVSQGSMDLRNVFASGMVYISESKLSAYGLTKIAGSMPSADDEVCITKWQYECLKALNETNISSYEDVLGKQLNKSAYQYKIVGIIDDGKDMTKFKEIKPEEVNNDFLFKMQLSRELDFGFSNMLFVAENHYNDLLKKEISIDLGIRYGENDSNSFWTNYVRSGDLYNVYIKDKYPEYCIEQYNDSIYHVSGEMFDYDNEFRTIADDEIIMPIGAIANLLNINESEVKTAINSSTPLIANIIKSQYNHSTYNYDYTNLLSLKIVGYSENYNYIVSEQNKNLMNVDNIENFIYVEIGENRTEYHIGSFYTNEECYRNSYYSYYPDMTDWIENKFRNIYLKNNAQFYNGSEFYQLQDNQVIMPSYCFQNTIGTGEELHQAIDEGLVVTIFPWHDNKKALVKLTVVGVYDNGSEYWVNKNTQKTQFEPLTKGFDYTVALLSNNDAENESFIKYCETFNDDEFKYTIQNGTTPILDNFGDIIESLAEVFLYIGLFFAVFAAFLLMNFITTSISHKRREIGILRALGARGTDVFGIFFNESAIIAFINFLLASITTFIVCIILNGTIISQLGVELVALNFGIRQVALILGVSMLTAFISSLAPVIKISRKKPIDAINNR